MLQHGDENENADSRASILDIGTVAHQVKEFVDEAEMQNLSFAEVTAMVQNELCYAIV